MLLNSGKRKRKALAKNGKLQERLTPYDCHPFVDAPKSMNLVLHITYIFRKRSFDLIQYSKKNSALKKKIRILVYTELLK